MKIIYILLRRNTINLKTLFHLIFLPNKSKIDFKFKFQFKELFCYLKERISDYMLISLRN
jgi:hypothetical protein